MPSEHPLALPTDPAVPEREPPPPATKLCGRCSSPTPGDAQAVPPAADSQITLEAAPLCASCSGCVPPITPVPCSQDTQEELERALRQLSWQAREPLRVDTNVGDKELHPKTQAGERSTVEASRDRLSASSTRSSTKIKAPIHCPPIQPSRSQNTSSESFVARSPTTAFQAPELLTKRQAEKQPATSSYLPDPFLDITRLRIRPRGYHCLYPGATFSGTQKSGKSGYDVSVTIVDVDVASSFLCGYLTIRGLTDDWPEMTTYFDAEIIGSRHGFLTQKWGATEAEDMLHWAKFPAFRHARPEVAGPSMTMADRDRGAVFMRWKERFLVPDHRVQDISGASFAGFYYVCVDFSSHGAPSSRPPPTQRAATEGDYLAASKLDAAARARAPVSASSMGRRSSSFGGSRGTANMSGFYYHQNSEPYQQLSLQHVPENTTSCFEFR